MKAKFIIVVGALMAWSCTSDEPLTPVNQLPTISVTDGKQEALGAFVSGAHPTSGTVKLVIDKTDASKKYLSFENFKTDPGPDLYIYLAEDKNAKGFTSVAKLSKTGTFTLDIPSEAMTDKQKYVLVWCKQFTVLFGSAKLE
ncbi:MAG: DM13 domain-containing protein [Arcicella sp.]|jgi:hypothetical protein|nr:DM13 domain-containing protein [Arcicella sp.]